jgi:hypothetical protein
MYLCHVSDWGCYLSELANYSTIQLRLFLQLGEWGGCWAVQELSALPGSSHLSRGQ